jgi:transcriptional regulator with GAF, ATPase, and Fis domain
MILTTGSTLHLFVPETETAEVAAENGAKAGERAHLLQVLNDIGWRIRGAHGAAMLLGLNPTTLESRIKKLGLIRPGTH